MMDFKDGRKRQVFDGSILDLGVEMAQAYTFVEVMKGYVAK